MKPTFLLINPWIYDFAAVNMWSKPLGLFKVAEFLSAYDVDLGFIDCLETYDPRKYSMGRYPKHFLPNPQLLQGLKRRYGRYGISVDEFTTRVRKYMPFDAVLITSIMTYWYPGVNEVIQRLRKLSYDAPVILGGMYATLNEKHASKNSGADFLFRGKIDARILSLLSEIGFKLKRVRDHYPFYVLKLCNTMNYAPLLTSEGCPYRCSYCASGLLNDRYIQENPDDIVRQINELYDRGVRDFAFYDDALLYKPDDHIKRILKDIIHDGLAVRFHTPNGLHARFVDADLADLMKKAGFTTICLSLETVNSERQQSTGGKVTGEELKKALNALKRAGFTKKELGVYLMYGLPGQGIEEVWDSVRFLKDLGVKIHLAEFSPIPGTDAWDDLVSSGVITEDIDPLLTNNTVYASLFSDYKPEQLSELRKEVKKYNSTFSKTGGVHRDSVP